MSLPRRISGKVILVISGPGRMMYQRLEPEPEGAIFAKEVSASGGLQHSSRRWRQYGKLAGNKHTRRASQLAGRSMSTSLSSERTLQPRNDQRDRRTCYRKVKANTEEEATVMGTLRGHRGMGGGTRAQSSGVNWGTSGYPPQADFLGCSSPRREFISGGEEFRGSDEAVVSDNPSGQHNPMASQGPLDGRVSVAGGRATLNREVLERVIPSGIADSWELQLRLRIRRSRGADVDGT